MMEVSCSVIKTFEVRKALKEVVSNTNLAIKLLCAIYSLFGMIGQTINAMMHTG